MQIILLYPIMETFGANQFYNLYKLIPFDCFVQTKRSFKHRLLIGMAGLNELASQLSCVRKQLVVIPKTRVAAGGRISVALWCVCLLLEIKKLNYKTSISVAPLPNLTASQSRENVVSGATTSACAGRHLCLLSSYS